MDARSYSAGEITARIGGNEPDGEFHRRGYNGIFSLTSKHEDRNVFVPLWAGSNFEHIFDGSTDEPDPLYDPRRSSMEVTHRGPEGCRLAQATTPHYGLESRTDFTLRAPYYIDVDFSCVPRRQMFANGYLGLFWASYINAPENKAIFFRGLNPRIEGERWLSFQNQFANRDASVPHRDADASLPFVKGAYELWWLFLGVSQLRFTEPFFFGIFRGMALIFMFEEIEGLRFAHSSYGGETFLHDDYHNPAWDFHYIIGNPKVGERYSFRWRIAYKKYVSREDARQEYLLWREGLDHDH